MSCNLYVPFSFMCLQHPKEEVQEINLDPTITAKDRPICSLCQVDNRIDCHRIEAVFEFLYQTQTKYKNWKEDIQNLKSLHQSVSETIIKYLNSLDSQIQNLENTVESQKQISEEVLDFHLLRKNENEYTTLQLGNFMERFSGLLRIEDSKLKFNNPFCSQINSETYKKIKLDLQNLQNFVPDYKLQSSIDYPKGISKIEFNKTGKLLAILNQIIAEDSSWSIWSVDQSNKLNLCQKFKGHTGQLTSICFSSNDQIITGSFDTQAILWRKNNPQKNEWSQFQAFEAHQFTVQNVKFSNTEKFIATAAKELILWEEENLNKEWKETYTEMHDKSVISLCFNQDDTILVTGDFAKKIVVSVYNNGWQPINELTDSVDLPRYLFFLKEDFVCLTTNNETLYEKIKQNGQVQYQQRRVLQRNMQTESASYCEDQNLQVTCSKNQIIFSKIIEKKLQIFQILATPCKTIQFSKNGKALAVSSEKKLSLYSKNQTI